MSKFKYKAKDFRGNLISGISEAGDKDELSKSLLLKNYYLISAEIIKKEKRGDFGLKVLRKRISQKEKLMFTRQLSVLTGAGFPLEKSLSVLVNQITNQRLKSILINIRDNILKGVAFSEALKKHPDVFEDLYYNMIKVGEETGNLKGVLDLLFNQQKKEYDLRARIKGAMIYPAIIFSLMVIIGIVMMIVVIPKFSKMFEDLKVPLPLTTQFIISVGNFMAQFWYSVPIGLAILFILIQRGKKTKKGRRMIDWLLLNFPLIGFLNKQINATRIARIFSSLLRGGVPIVTSIEITADTISNIYFKDSLRIASREVKKGKSIKEALKKYSELYTFLLLDMIDIGEKTGELSNILSKLADFYEEEVDNTTNNLSSIIEPVLMIIIGGVVGLLAVSIIQPMYGMLGGV